MRITLVLIVINLNPIKCSLLDAMLNMEQKSQLLHDPDLGLTTPELIHRRHFQSQTHHVITTDGYILSVHRIVNPKFYGQKLKVYYNLDSTE